MTISLGYGRMLDALDQVCAPDSNDIKRYMLGEELLRWSNGRHGWDLYDLHPSRPADRLTTIPRWTGGRCEHLVVVAEQGFGDAIQFLPYVPKIRRYAAKITLAVHDELAELVATSPLLRGIEVITKKHARHRDWSQGTVWERLMSLPAQLPEADVGAIGQYLTPPSIPKHLSLPALASPTVTVGVAWRSTPRRGFPSRSFPAGLVRLLAAGPDVRTVSIHRHTDTSNPHHGALVLPIANFTDTAAVIVACDVVVTADTVTAHLAPALGVPTIVCLRHLPDWRWGTPEQPTTWYANAIPMFQGPDRQWAPVLRQAAEYVRGFARSRT